MLSEKTVTVHRLDQPGKYRYTHGTSIRLELMGMMGSLCYPAIGKLFRCWQRISTNAMIGTSTPLQQLKYTGCLPVVWYRADSLVCTECIDMLWSSLPSLASRSFSVSGPGWCLIIAYYISFLSVFQEFVLILRIEE